MDAILIAHVRPIKKLPKSFMAVAPQSMNEHSKNKRIGKNPNPSGASQGKRRTREHGLGPNPTTSSFSSCRLLRLPS
jgi:hypothetical protein